MLFKILLALFIPTAFVGLVRPDSTTSIGVGGSFRAEDAVYSRVDGLRLQGTNGGIVVGGMPLTSWQREGGLWKADLAQMGPTDLGGVENRYTLRRQPWEAELLVRGRPATLSRWKNLGWAQTTNDDPSGKKVVLGENPPSVAPTRFLRLAGYLGQEWSYETSEASLQGRTVLSKQPHQYGVKPGMRMNLFGAKEFVDQDGEYSFDPKGRTVYYRGTEPTDAWLTTGNEAMYKFVNSRNIVLKGITFVGGRGSQILLENCEDVRIENCTFIGAGMSSIRIRGGRDISVLNCKFVDPGTFGIDAIAGDRSTLRSSDIVVQGCEFRRWGRNLRTAVQAIHADAVGMRIIDCVFSDAYDGAIRVWSNNVTVNDCTFDSVCKEVIDGGAFYIGRDWSVLGTELTNCTFRNILNRVNTKRGTGLVHAVYLDDQAGGLKAIGNRFENCEQGVFIGGGRWNVIEDNDFRKIRDAAVVIDARGTTFAADKNRKGSGTMWKNLDAVPWRGPTWQRAYPFLKDFERKSPELPLENILRNNSVDAGSRFLRMSGEIKSERQIGLLVEGTRR